MRYREELAKVPLASKQKSIKAITYFYRRGMSHANCCLLLLTTNLLTKVWSDHMPLAVIVHGGT